MTTRDSVIVTFRDGGIRSLEEVKGFEDGENYLAFQRHDDSIQAYKHEDVSEWSYKRGPEIPQEEKA